MTQIQEPQYGMNSPVITQDMSDEDMDKMMASACDASALLKAISHEGRLMILCALVTGEKSVTELEELLHARQAHSVALLINPFERGGLFSVYHI